MTEESKVLKKPILVSEEEEHLFHLIREMKNGEMRIIVSEGDLVQAEQIERDIEL